MPYICAYSSTVSHITFSYPETILGAKAAYIVLCFLNSCRVSGNTDVVLPVTSTRYSIDALKLPTVSPWRAWYDDGEVSQ